MGSTAHDRNRVAELANEAWLREWACAIGPMPEIDVAVPTNDGGRYDDYDPADALCRAIASPTPSAQDPHEAWVERPSGKAAE